MTNFIDQSFLRIMNYRWISDPTIFIYLRYLNNQYHSIKMNFRLIHLIFDMIPYLLKYSFNFY